MKRVLVIATYFPPLGGIAQQRIASFVRHLPSAGWEPSVVTIEWTRHNSKVIDESLCDDELERRVVFRSREPDLRRGGRLPIPPLFRPANFFLDWRAAVAQLADRYRHGERVEGSNYFFRGASRFLEGHLATNKYDLILATSPDLAAHRIASVASERCGVPWVADCRDDYATFKAGCPAYVRTELKCLRNASLIVTVSHGLREALAARTGKRVEVVENGFEAVALQALRQTGRHLESEALNFVYTGTLANYLPERDPKILVEGMARFVAKHEAARDRLRLHFFGDLNLAPMIDAIHSRFPLLKEVVVDHGRVPMEVAHEVQREGDVLLLLAHPGLKGILTGKVFEYLAARRPIVCVPGDEDELDELLKRTGGGISLPDVEAAESFVAETFAQWANEGALPDLIPNEVLMTYERGALTRKLAAHLDSLLPQSSVTAIS